MQLNPKSENPHLPTCNNLQNSNFANLTTQQNPTTQTQHPKNQQKHTIKRIKNQQLTQVIHTEFNKSIKPHQLKPPNYHSKTQINHIQLHQ